MCDIKIGSINNLTHRSHEMPRKRTKRIIINEVLSHPYILSPNYSLKVIFRMVLKSYLITKPVFRIYFSFIWIRIRLKL